jgi:Zn-dependent peptidase ImmA (M78 family)
MLESQLTDEFARDWFSKPADSLLALMNRRDIPVEAVVNLLPGGLETMRGLLRGTQPIDDRLARSLSTIVGGAPTYWIKRQADYERALDAALSKVAGEVDDWLTLVPSPLSRPRGRLSNDQRVAELRKRLAFYGVNNLRSWRSRYARVQDNTRFRTSRSFSSNVGSVALWLRQGELEAALTTTQHWNPTSLRSLVGKISRLSMIRQPDRFLPKLKSLGAEAGVAIVVVKAPGGCKASGASRLISPKKAMVLLSFRHLSDDHFWFTLFHEFGHLLLHGAHAFVDEDDTEIDDREREANEFASSCIVPYARWEEFSSLKLSRDAILRFSVSLGVSPGLVVGQLQHREAIGRDRFNFLKRRWSWDQIEARLS